MTIPNKTAPTSLAFLSSRRMPWRPLWRGWGRGKEARLLHQPQSHAKTALIWTRRKTTLPDYMQARKLNAAAAATAAVAAHGYNSDDEVYETARAVDANLDVGEDSDDPALYDKKKIDVLPPLNHAEIEYPDFEKNFYDEAPEIASLTPAQVNERRRQLGIRVSGFDAPKPIETF
eukprot:jgi/Botrbrau1/22651/Bobra.176_1s0073.1